MYYFFKAWLCFLYFFMNRANYSYSSVTKSLPISFKQPKGLRGYFSTSCIKNNKLSLEKLKASHLLYIRELYRDREASVVPFDRNLILATCSHCLDSKVKT